MESENVETTEAENVKKTFPNREFIQAWIKSEANLIQLLKIRTRWSVVLNVFLV